MDIIEIVSLIEYIDDAKKMTDQTVKDISDGMGYMVGLDLSVVRADLMEMREICKKMENEYLILMGIFGMNDTDNRELYDDRRNLKHKNRKLKDDSSC